MTATGQTAPGEFVYFEDGNSWGDDVPVVTGDSLESDPGCGGFRLENR